MFNGNKIMPIENDLTLINKKIIENKRNEKNYHYLDNTKRDLSYDIIHKSDNKKIINIKTNRSNSHKKEIKKGLPKFLCNIDLNKLSTFNNDNDDQNINENLLLTNSKEKRDISPEKYLEDILTGNEFENNIIISLDKNDNQNSLMSNTFKNSKEFDILKNTLFNEKINMNNLSKSLQITNNNKIDQIENESNLDKAKIINHDDIPIIVNNSNFMDLLEKELANENMYNLKYSTKSLDISQNKNSSNLSEKSLNNQQFLDKKENYERDDNDNKEKIKLIKLIKDTKNDIFNKRSKTPDNLLFKRTNKRKIFKNNKINFNENIPNISTDKKQNHYEKDIIKNNINNNNNFKNNFNQNNNYPNQFQQKKIKNIINNNSITIISHFDIEENSIKKNSDINYNNNDNNIENKELNDSTDKDITNYMCEDEEKEKEKIDLVQKKINELNYEINKFKEERNNLNKTKIYYEKLKSKLMSDIEIFNKQKEEFKKYIVDEVEKVKIKQQKYKSNNKIIKNLKTENDILVKKNQESKEIIESLKDQIYQLQSKIKMKNNINLSNKKTNNSKFQSIEDTNNNNSTLRQIFNKQDNNKNDNISHKDKLYRNRSSLGINKTSDDNINKNEKRLNTFVTEKEIYPIKANSKEDDISFDIQNNKQNKKTNLIYEQKSHYSSKTYQAKIFQKRKNPINNIDINKDDDNNNIITKERYNNILKLINKSFRKSNRNNDDKSFIEKTNVLKLNHTKIENKKRIIKCKSNININSDKKNLIPQNSGKRLAKNNLNKNINLTNKKDSNLVQQNKLTLEDYEFKIPDKYKKHKYKLIKTLKTGDKLINIYNENKKEIIFSSGVRKEIFEDGHQIIFFVNGDIKQNYPCGKSVYFFNQAKTVQTTFKNGIFVMKFENNQVERHYPDGKKEILYPDGSEKTILENGNEMSSYSEENSITNYK